MKTGRVLITDDVHPLLIEGLEKAGYECDYFPDITLEETRQRAGSYDGLVINSKIRVDAPMLEGAPSIRFVGRLGSGLDIIDLPAVARHGVRVLSVPEGNCNAVAEHAMGMLLALVNNLVRADREVRQRIWHREKNRGIELEGRKIGIIGFGHTGSAFARKLAGFDVRVLAYDKYKEGYAEGYPHVSVISFHLPLTDETHHLVNRDLIGSMKKGVILINTSRGKVVDIPSLVEGLEQGRIGGACLDVFENEKPETYTESEASWYERLFAMDQLILSPHVAGWTKESKEKIARYLLHKILDA